MLRKKSKDLVWYEFELLQNLPIKHAVFTRNGGVSKFPFDSLNVGDSVGDDPVAIAENKRRMAKLLQLKKLTFLNQEHKDGIEEIKSGDEVLNADGMITTKKNVGIAIRHADCQAAIFYDTKNHVLANVHAGWRGNVQNIYARTLEKMKALANTDPKDVIACISPSLGPIAAEFVNYENELPQSFWKHKDAKNRFDLWGIARQQLKDCGIPEKQIEIASICTHANEGDFYSYRRERATGRNATVCALTV